MIGLSARPSWIYSGSACVHSMRIRQLSAIDRASLCAGHDSCGKRAVRAPGNSAPQHPGDSLDRDYAAAISGTVKGLGATPAPIPRQHVWFSASRCVRQGMQAPVSCSAAALLPIGTHPAKRPPRTIPMGSRNIELFALLSEETRTASAQPRFRLGSLTLQADEGAPPGLVT